MSTTPWYPTHFLIFPSGYLPLRIDDKPEEGGTLHLLRDHHGKPHGKIHPTEAPWVYTYVAEGSPATHLVVNLLALAKAGLILTDPTAQWRFQPPTEPGLYYRLRFGRVDQTKLATPMLCKIFTRHNGALYIWREDMAPDTGVPYDPGQPSAEVTMWSRLIQPQIPTPEAVANALVQQTLYNKVQG